MLDVFNMKKVQLLLYSKMICQIIPPCVITEVEHVPQATVFKIFSFLFHRVIAMAVFGEPAKQNTFSGVALAKQSGKVEIQYFKESLTVPSTDDKEKLDSFLHNAFLM